MVEPILKFMNSESKYKYRFVHKNKQNNDSFIKVNVNRTSQGRTILFVMNKNPRTKWLFQLNSNVIIGFTSFDYDMREHNFTDTNHNKILTQ